MAIELPNGKISRTLPEQVGFNSAKIEEIIKFLNESGLKDQVINLTSLSGTLTPEQYAIAELSPSYIVYEGTIFFKGVEDLSNIDYFELTPQIETDSSMLLNMSRIRVVRDTRAYSQSYVNLFETYNKSQINSAISTLNTAIASKASLSGANFTGGITAPSIIENSANYTFEKRTNDYQWNPLFVGICKNGNKITISCFFNFTFSVSGVSNPVLGYLRNIPTEIIEKVQTFTIGSTDDIVDLQTIGIVSTDWQYKTLHCALIKPTYLTNAMAIKLFDLNSSSLTDGKTYVVRYECTILLSDNLIQ